MEEDIQNYSPTVMFRGPPCMLDQRVRVLEFEISSCKHIGVNH